MGAVRPDVGAMVTSVIILSLRPVRPMRPDAQDGKCIFRDVVAVENIAVASTAAVDTAVAVGIAVVDFA